MFSPCIRAMCYGCAFVAAVVSSQVALAEEGYLRSQTRVINVGKEMAKSEAVQQKAQEQQPATIFINGDTVIKSTDQMPVTIEKKDAVDVSNKNEAVDVAPEATSVEVVVPAAEVEAEKPRELTARERIHERIRKNRAGEQ